MLDAWRQLVRLLSSLLPVPTAVNPVASGSAATTEFIAPLAPGWSGYAEPGWMACVTQGDNIAGPHGRPQGDPALQAHPHNL
jgi:hypothetical protein